ncbi:MAG TPA: hypothetical protein VH933_09880 [Aestuariivirgaceae bacterium]
MNKVTTPLPLYMRKLAAWNKARPIPGFDPSKFRRDRFGGTIMWSQYGQCTEYGWEIDHILPASFGGLSFAGNEAATHWQNNRSKSNRFIG